MAVKQSLTLRQVLDIVPQRPPFRFLDELLELDESHAVGRYTFRPDESFYAGHYPGNPVTPGVILLETMAQTGVVALGMYLKSLEVPLEDLKSWVALFTDAEVEFLDLVRPGDQVVSTARKIFWRGNKIRSEVLMVRTADGKEVARSTVAGMGVRRE